MDPIFLSWLVFVAWVQEKGGCKSLGDPGVCPDAEPRIRPGTSRQSLTPIVSLNYSSVFIITFVYNRITV